jgi:HEAT repeat protein
VTACRSTPSRNLELTSLARAHTETAINVLFGILSNADAPVRMRIKAAKILLSLPAQAFNEVSETNDLANQNAHKLPH